jgi:prepilin-type N-terminal cleavage/methylation domain-containing protein
MTSTTGRRNNPRRGFTLLELILVMVLLAVVAGIAAPSLRGFLHGRAEVNAASQMLALGQYARTQAIGAGQLYRLNVDALSGTYWLTIRRGQLDQDLSNEFGRRFTLPDGMKAEWEATTVTGTSIYGTATPTSGMNANAASTTSIPLVNGAVPNYFDFYPDGRVQAGTLKLTARTGQVFELGCKSETEPLVLLDGRTP